MRWKTGICFVKQILRSGTSIGANIKEAQAAQSRNDFLAKMYVAYKEANETILVRTAIESNYIDEKSFRSIYNDNKELLKLLTAITKTIRNEKH